MATIETNPQLGEQILTAMTKWRMADIVHQRHTFNEIFVETQAPGSNTRDLCHLDGVGQARAEVITLVVGENLSLVLQTPERAAVDDAIAVALKLTAEVVGDAGVLTAT